MQCMVSSSTIVLNSRHQPKTMVATIYAPLKPMLGCRFCEKLTLNVLAPTESF